MRIAGCLCAFVSLWFKADGLVLSIAKPRRRAEGAEPTATGVPLPLLADDNAAMTDVRSTVEWLVDGARTAATPEGVLEEMCARLVADGLPLWRVSVFVRTLHPDLMGRRLRWELGKALDVDETPIEVLGSEMFRTSPVLAITTTGRSLRRRLLAPDCPARSAAAIRKRSRRRSGSRTCAVSPSLPTARPGRR